MRPFSDFSWRVVRAIAITTVLAASLFYVFALHAYLENNEWEHVSGLTRIIIPDTFLYAALVDEDDLVNSMFFSGVKNSIGPSTIWYIAGFNWYAVSLINVIFLYLITVYIEKNCQFYGVNKTAMRWSVLLFIASPATVFYSVGALKEFPMMLSILMALYYFNKKARGLAIFAALMLVILRYQMIVILLLVAVFSGFKNKILSRIVVLLLAAAAAYPALEGLGFLAPGATEFFREEYGQQGGLGTVVEYVRSNVFVVSAFAVLIRTMQSFFEPILTVLGRGSFFVDGSFSVFDFVQFFTLLMFLPFFWWFLSESIFILRHGRRISKEVQVLYGLIVASFILVGGFSFIHHRYLYPFFPLLLIAGLIPRTRLSLQNTISK